MHTLCTAYKTAAQASGISAQPSDCERRAMHLGLGEATRTWWSHQAARIGSHHTLWELQLVDPPRQAAAQVTQVLHVVLLVREENTHHMGLPPRMMPFLPTATLAAGWCWMYMPWLGIPEYFPRFHVCLGVKSHICWALERKIHFLTLGFGVQRLRSNYSDLTPHDLSPNGGLEREIALF